MSAISGGDLSPAVELGVALRVGRSILDRRIEKGLGVELRRLVTTGPSFPAWQLVPAWRKRGEPIEQRSVRLRDDVGCVGVVTDAKPDAVGYYERIGFRSMGGVVEGHVHGEPLPMFLPLAAVLDAVSDE